MDFESRALSSIKEILRTYFVDRDYTPLQACLAPHVSWFGTGSHEIAHSSQEAALLLEAERLSWPGHFDIVEQDYHSTALTPESCCIQARFLLRQNDSTDLLPMEFPCVSAVSAVKRKAPCASSCCMLRPRTPPRPSRNTCPASTPPHKTGDCGHCWTNARRN